MIGSEIIMQVKVDGIKVLTHNNAVHGYKMLSKALNTWLA